MNILHINSEYSNKSLHKNLVNSLVGRVSHQYVYVPLRKASGIDENKIVDQNITFYYANILNFFLRLRYFRKIKKIFRDLENKISNKNIDLVHAHTLFSSGGGAYLVNRIYNTPYIITVRNTDINIFYKYFFYLKPFSYKILKNASKIIVLSPKYKHHLKRKLPEKYAFSLDNKIISIPNGIDDFWFSNINKSKKTISGKIKLLFVGDLNANKNVWNVIELVKRLNEKRILSELVVIGDGKYREKVIKEASKYRFLTFYPKTESKATLLEFYRNADIFVMPSFRETFGLVYGEAMSQGLPVIYSKGQGIDGYFEEGEVGYSVNPKDLNDIAYKVQLILKNYKTISKNCIKNVQQFKWETIAYIYKNIYNECIR